MIVALFGGVAAASDLPDCPSDKSKWDNCFGSYTQSDGSKYVGEFKNRKYSGQGTNTHADGSKYVGEFKNGKREGQGATFFTDGTKYFGGYKNDNYSGQGTIIFADGSTYVGQWKDNAMQGYGTSTFPDGNKYEGEYNNNKRNGQGIFTFSDGRTYDGQWKNGKFKGSKIPTKPSPVSKTPPKNGEVLPASSGSGFAVSSDGYVITNSHVIDGCQDVFVHTPKKDFKMRVITNDPKNDLALLKGNFIPLAVFSLSTERPEILQDIYVAGYPFGKKVSSSVKVTKGIISSLTGIGNDFSNFQMDAALQSGNSGGPVLDDMGNVVGVAVAKLDAMQMLKDTGSIPENTNFGIKSNVVKSVLDSSSVDVPSANTSPISKSQLGKMITDGTYYISCWMTMAQIEKVRSKKVLFSEFD